MAIEFSSHIAQTIMSANQSAQCHTDSITEEDKTLISYEKECGGNAFLSQINVIKEIYFLE